MNQTPTKTGIIAIVDDDGALREALGSVMKAAGFLGEGHLTPQRNSLLVCDCDETACLILDVRLPGMSGIELQRRLADAGSTLPIIFVTAHGDEVASRFAHESRGFGLSFISPCEATHC